MTPFDLSDILEKIIAKAEEDAIITEDEKELIEKIKVEISELSPMLVTDTDEEEAKSTLQKLLASTSTQFLHDIISQARVDGKISRDEQEILNVLFEELGYSLKEFEQRVWFVFKICIKIDYQSDIDALLNAFDRVFCLRSINPIRVYSGLCLGTKHYVIEDTDVTLLSFALTPDTTSEWVTKGAFAIIEFNKDTINRDLERLAHDLLVENYLSKKQ